MTEEKIRYAYRICPCFSYDIEGIQTWLEDLAAEGLLLEADGTFLGIFTFQKTRPQKVRYRLAPIKQKKGFFSDSSDGPEAEEQEFSAQCGWEYMVRYGSFHIYRATDPAARPLHTDPAVQAMALGALKKQRRNAVISQVLFWVIWFTLRGTSVFTLFLTGALLGPLHIAAVTGLVLWVSLRLLAFAIRLSRYQKRLRLGDSLEQRRDWKKTVPAVWCGKLLPWALALVLAITWGMGLKNSYERVPLDEIPQPLPFASLADVFPGAELDNSSAMGDYGTAVHYSTALSENYEWNETADITAGDLSGYGILRLNYHETASEFLAKGVAEDYYRSEAARYRGKRFEDITAPETGLDNVRVYSSYGTLHVLIQHENKVIHAVVLLKDRNQNNHWQAWLEAMEQKLLG